MAADRVTRNGADMTAAAPANPVLSFWTDYFERTGEQSKAFVEGLNAILDPQKLQQRWLDALAQNFDEFMRSPAFLEMMRQNLKTMTDLKKAQDKALEETARSIGAPLASDIHGLFERLAGLERALLARLEAVESRLASIEASRIPAPPTRAKSTGSRSKPRRTKSTKAS
jgi:hypothetical protein